MPSLRQLLATHDTALLLDAASARVQVGWLTRDGDWRWQASDEEAGVGVFRGLETLGIDVAAAGAFVFCEGPGSILGVRTTAVAVRTWNVLRPRPVYGYKSLALIGHGAEARNATVIADARRDSWHSFRRGEPLRRVPTAELHGELVMPENFRHWSAVPANVRTVPYALPALLPALIDEDLFSVAEHPDAFLHEEPSYVTWTPQIHRAPASS